jgi:uncharacterized membrane protein SpoIIM required for sporulation
VCLNVEIPWKIVAMPDKESNQQIESQEATKSRFRLSIVCLQIAGYIFVLGLGAIYGVSAYQLFTKFYSEPDQGLSGQMLVAFLFGIPFAIGLLVGFIAKRRRLAGVSGASMLSVLSISLFVFAAGSYLKEGTICIVMAAPIFLVFAIIGAIVGALYSHYSGDKSPKILSLALLIPFIIAPAEKQVVSATKQQITKRSIYISASPETVWKHINYPLHIKPAELSNGFAYRIGVPYPLEARTVDEKIGGKRQLLWQRGVTFEEEIVAWQPYKLIAWKYLFQPNSFPPGALDEHIVIGGRYFNLETTSYSLTPEGVGTLLTITVGTSITTNFNWYAGLWSKFLIEDTADTILNFYKVRSEG